MTVSLKDRFLKSALSPLSIFLRLTGIQLGICELNWRSQLVRFWGIVLLLICTQSNLYITIKRTQMLNDFFSFLPHVKGFVRELVNAIFRLSALISDILVHVTLVFNIWPKIKSFLVSLESVDYDLKRPNLFRVKQISFIGLVYTLCMVS